MDDNKDFYKKFNSDSTRQGGFVRNVFVPFISGVLGATLILGMAFGVPDIREKIINSTSTSSASNLIESSNLGTVDYISLKKYSDTATYAASKVLPSIVGVKLLIFYNICHK